MGIVTFVGFCVEGGSIFVGGFWVVLYSILSGDFASICLSFFGYVGDVVDLGLDYLKVVGLWGWDFVGIVGYALYVWLEVPIGCRWECGICGGVSSSLFDEAVGN